MKRIIFVAQSKGGAGKSALTKILAHKNPKALLVDMDDASRTISNLLKDREVMFFSFLSSYRHTDRGRLFNFYEMVNGDNHNFFICDLSPTAAHQLLFHFDTKFNDIRNGLSEIFAEFGIAFELNIVVGGGDIFTTTMAYLKDIQQVVNQEFPIKVYKNDYFPFSEEQDQLLEEYANKHNLEVIPFGRVGSSKAPQSID